MGQRSRGPVGEIEDITTEDGNNAAAVARWAARRGRLA